MDGLLGVKRGWTSKRSRDGYGSPGVGLQSMGLVEGTNPGVSMWDLETLKRLNKEREKSLKEAKRLRAIQADRKVDPSPRTVLRVVGA